MRVLAIVCWIVIICGAPGTAAADTYTITLDPAARQEPADGRVILFFITQTGQDWGFRNPVDGPFFEAPQPIASIEVKDFKPGDSIRFDTTSKDVVMSEPLEKLSGTVRVQAILDTDQTERSHTQGPGNVYSDVLTINLSAEKSDDVAIKLTHRVEPPKRVDGRNLKWVSLRSEMLSRFYGRDIYHRAGVALPMQYDDPNWPRQQWPAIYVIPGFGDRDDGAEDFADMLEGPAIEEIAPMAVYIVLDPESPLGHHGFADSANNGPRATALVKEFIPYLESQFRLVAKPEARIVTGHSSGGWSSLWLQLNHPEAFGACWSRSPDPVDFTAFQKTNLYLDHSMYENEQGEATPSFQVLSREGGMRVPMTVRQECAMETAIDPNGRSGQQWDAWEAVFSSKDPQSGMPVRIFDRATGVLNKGAIRNWGKYDISQQLMMKWHRYGPVMLERVRLACGENDSFYLNFAVEHLKQTIEQQKAQFPEATPQQPDGYILLVPGADHGSIVGKTFQRWNAEMRAYLQSHGLQDPDPPAKDVKPPLKTDGHE